MRSQLSSIILATAAALAGPAVAEPTTTAAAPAPAIRSVVTRAFLRELAGDKAAFAAVVDRDAGLVFIDHFAGAAGGPDKPTERLLCGRALDRQLRIIRGWMYAAIHGPDEDDSSWGCRNRPGPTCAFGGTMEYDPVVHLRFRVDPARGVVLQAITIDDEVLVDGREVDREHRAQDRLIARLGARTCATTP